MDENKKLDRLDEFGDQSLLEDFLAPPQESENPNDKLRDLLKVSSDRSEASRLQKLEQEAAALAQAQADALARSEALAQNPAPNTSTEPSHASQNAAPQTPPYFQSSDARKSAVAQTDAHQEAQQLTQLHTPENPLHHLKAQTKAYFESKDQDEQDPHSEHKGSSLLHEERLLGSDHSEHSEIKKRNTNASKIQPVPVWKRRFQLDSASNKSPSKVQPKLFYTLLLVLIALVPILLFFGLRLLHKEDHQNFVKSFFAQNESQEYEVKSSLETIDQPQALIRIRRPRFEDDYLDNLLTIWLNNLKNAFLYQHSDPATEKNNLKPTLAVDFKLAERGSRLLSLAIKIDRWLPQAEAQSLETPNDTLGRGTLFGLKGASALNTPANQGGAEQYGCTYYVFYYDRYLHRLIQMDELFDASSISGILREQHLALNDQLPEESKIPEVPTELNQKRQPVILFHDQGVEEVRDWISPALGLDENGVKRKIPVDSYQASSSQLLDNRPKLYDYSLFQNALYMELRETSSASQDDEENTDELSEEDERLLGLDAMQKRQSQAEEKESQQDVNARTEITEARLGNGLLAPASTSTSTQEESSAVEDEVGGRRSRLSYNPKSVQTSSLFFPRQANPFWKEGQALFMDLPDPYSGGLPNSNKDFKYVALTFDNGPYEAYTPLFLDLLHDNKSYGTFFVVGTTYDKSVEYLIQDIVKAGHELGNLGYTFQPLTQISVEDMLQDLALNAANIDRITSGQYQLKITRPPFGSITEERAQLIRQPIFLWSVDSMDIVNDADPDFSSEQIMSNIQAGDIVLLHDTNTVSLYALTKVLPQLYQQGYRFVTVSQLFDLYGRSPQPGQIYHSIRDAE